MLQYQQPATDLNHTRPALSTLATIASDHSSHLRTYNNGNHIMMTYATSSPAATTGGGQGNNHIPPVCQNCATSTTPLWRRDEIGSVLCNACGLFLKLHGTPRPISLKTDVIKSRHRVKTASQALKKRSLFEGNDISVLTARSEAGTPPSNHPNNYRRPSQKTSSSRGSERSYSPLSRSDTPSIRHPSNNIAPQHLFDGISMPPEHNFQPSPSIPPLNLRQQSPSSLEPPQTYDTLLQSSTALKTRVSELEVINDLFRGRVTQLEQNDENSRRTELMQRQTEKNLRQLLEESQVREMDLQRRISDLQRELAEFRGGASSGSGGGGVGGEEQQLQQQQQQQQQQQSSRSAKRQRMSSDDYNNNSNSSNHNTMLPRGMPSLVDMVGMGGVPSSTPSPSMYSGTATTNGGIQQQQQQQQQLSTDGNEYGGRRVPDGGHHEYGHLHNLPRVSDGNEYNNLPVISTA